MRTHKSTSLSMLEEDEVWIDARVQSLKLQSRSQYFMQLYRRDRAECERGNTGFTIVAEQAALYNSNIVNETHTGSHNNTLPANKPKRK